MSAIAQILRDRGETVSGSDRQESETTRRLSASGIGVHIGHDGGNINGADVVVYSAAIRLTTLRFRQQENGAYPCLSVLQCWARS